MAETTPVLTAKDFTSNQDVRWCPGCGDYSILANVQRVMPELGLPRENFVFVSGIGCSSRFPYYMNTYGMHTIHGRAPAFATGIKAARPELSVWVVTGDGDGLSIGGNHLLHTIRRNVDLQILLFNNRVYGLTKGQYSPTSRIGMKTKSTPDGAIDHPIDPIAFALGAGATFVARTIDVHAPHLQEMLRRAHEHKGTAFIEILQNCPVYNDDEWIEVEDRKSRIEAALDLEDGQPLLWGAETSLLIGSTGRSAVFRAAQLISHSILPRVLRRWPMRFNDGFASYDGSPGSGHSLRRRQVSTARSIFNGQS